MTESEFLAKVERKESWKCWPYLGYKDKEGYGRVHTDNGLIGAHVYAWKLTRKCEVPEGMYILHMCDNSSCCNPNHLYAGTQLDNMRDKRERGHIPSAYALASNLKLHEGEIWLIRKLRIPIRSNYPNGRYKFSQTKVAKMFKVDQSLISLIWNSDKWLSLEGTYA